MTPLNKNNILIFKFYNSYSNITFNSKSLNIYNNFSIFDSENSYNSLSSKITFKTFFNSAKNKVSNDDSKNSASLDSAPVTQVPEIKDSVSKNFELETKFAEKASLGQTSIPDSSKGDLSDSKEIPKSLKVGKDIDDQKLDITQTNSDTDTKFTQSVDYDTQSLDLKSLNQLIADAVSAQSLKHTNNTYINNSSNITTDSNTLNDKLVVVQDEGSPIPEKFDLDFLSYSKDTQVEINNIFDFYVLKENTYIVPDIELNHIKSPSNKLVLIKLIDHLPYKLEVWDKIYKFYFKSLFLIVSKLNPLSIKHLRGIESKLLQNDSLIPTPIFNLTSNIDSSISKAVYGFANGLHELSFFLPSKFSRIEIDYDFNLKTPFTHEVTINWYYINSENKEIKISKAIKTTDLNFETSIVVDSWDFKDSESMFYAKSYKNIFNELYTLEKSEIDVHTLQASSLTKHVITTTKDVNNILWADGSSSRFMINGPVGFDFSNFYLLNTFISLLKIDNLGIDIENNDSDRIINDFAIYLAAMIKHFILSKIMPSSLALKSLKSSFSIKTDTKYQSLDELHNKFKLLVRSGELYPCTPVQFDFYFYKNTINRFSEFIILSSFSNISINRLLKPVIPINDKSSKMNFSLYAKNRSLLYANSYISDTSFDFQKLKYYILFDDLVVEMYIKSMLITKVPDYIPLITRGQWKGTNASSNPVYTSYLNSVLIKFSFTKSSDEIIRFILNIIGVSKDFYLGKSFKSKTRFVQVCPDLFERFVVESEISLDISPKYEETGVDYLPESKDSC